MAQVVAKIRIFLYVASSAKIVGSGGGVGVEYLPTDLKIPDLILQDITYYSLI